VLADFRVNLTVRAEDYEMAVTSGALFDEINGVLFVPPRFDLKPLEKWLPFDLSRLQREGGDGFVKVDDDCGIITWQPSIPKAAGPTKSDGSPNMSFAENIRVAEMIKPVTPGGRGGSGSAFKVASKARTQGTGTPPRRAAASPPRVAPGDGVFVAAQLRAAAVPYANYFAWFLVVVALGLFHKNIEAVLSVGFVLVAHSVLSVVGGHGGVSDMNVSLFEMATTPANVMVEAIEGNAIARGVISSLLVLLVFYMPFFARLGRRVLRLVVRFTNQHTVALVLIVFIWMCVMRASASPNPSTMIQQHRQLLPDVADRIVGPSAVVSANIRLAHAVSERWFHTVNIDFVDREELIAILGDENLPSALVWDTGARRHVVRSKSKFIKGSIKPCNFTVRGINSGGKQPACAWVTCRSHYHSAAARCIAVYSRGLCSSSPRPTISSVPACSRTTACARGAAHYPTGVRCTSRITGSSYCPRSVSTRRHTTSTPTRTASCSWASATASTSCRRSSSWSAGTTGA
jgi:hypothetical protein